MSLNEPLKAEIARRLAAAEATAKVADVEGVVFNLLDVFALLGRDIAQRSWLRHHDDDECDERMRVDEDEVVYQSLKSPFSKVYPELPAQVEAVLRDSFDDEHFRLADPLGWAEINTDDATAGETHR